MNNTERIAKLSPAKRNLFELALTKRGRGGLAEPGIPRAHIAGPAPLSFSQQRLWFLSQLEPDSPAYNQPKALQLSGAVNIEALKKALDTIVCRHEVLRTTFILADSGTPLQSAGQNRSVDFPLIDLSSCPDDTRNEELQRAITEITERRFDLSRDLMIRAALLRLAPSEHVFLLVTHHIATDGWSSGILWRELASLYAAFSTGAPNPLPELPVQYADYAVWQRGYLQGEVLEKQLSYWKRQLCGVPVLELPTDRPRPAVQSYRGARLSFAISKTVSEKLKTFSRKEGATLFMTLLAAFQTLLHRYTGQEDIVVGSPIANRTRAEIESLIGFFVNTLVLRTDISGDPTFRELIARVRKVALEAYGHQDLPFEKLVEELNPDRKSGRTPLFQVVFVLQNAPRSDLELRGLEVKSVRTGSDTAKFDLTLSIIEEPESLRASLEYSTDLFEAGTIARMLGHFQRLLEDIVADPERRLSELAILTEAEKRQIMVEWNDTGSDYPKDKCIHELFKAQVERTPDAVAVVFEGQQLTYRELNARANQLAHYLKKRGVEPEVLVGVCAERSVEIVVALLAIVKGGGAYVPLDPQYPKERLKFILEDTRASIIVTQRRLRDRLPSHEATVVYLDDGAAWATEPSENPVAAIRTENLLYVMYTSGSTGTPKGVSVVHRGVVRLVKNIDYAELASDEVFLQFAPISFDASTFEIWGALLNGAKLIVFPPHTPSLEELGRFIDFYRVTTLWLTAALFHQMVEGHLSRFKGVRQLLAGGDVLSVRHVEKCLHELPNCRLINGYGPTENTTFTCCYPMTDPKQVGHSVSIGRPIANTQVYVLDVRGNPAPVGVPGELYIGGDGLARGYFNQPELTREKFVPNPFSDEPGARLYRTGDLARYRSDGTIEFLGRLDHQVKIRGFRVELGEIEAVLSQHPTVRETVVIIRQDVMGEKRLVAYVVPSRKPTPSTSELRGFLEQKLPDYMMPSRFVFLECLPLTANGKVDRRALPVPDHARPELDGSFVAPRTLTEQFLEGIWAEVLKLEKVGIHDNFFDLGGHSLLATQVVSRVRQTFHTELALRSLFESPTIAGLAERIDASRREEEGFPVPPSPPMPRDGDSPLSFAQQRLWFLDQLEPNNSVYNIPSGLRLKGPLDIHALEQSLNEIVQRHEALRTTFSAVEGEPRQIISPSVTLPLPVVDLADRPESEREEEALRLISEGARRPFDLARGPLLRAMLVRLVPDDHILLLNMHHIVSDGWSLGILYRELAILYEAFSNRHPSPLPELPIQYADFAHWQRNRMQGAVLDAQVEYWKRQLRDLPVLELPTDRSRPATQTYRGARRSIVMPKALTAALETLSRREGVTLFMTLLAAFQTLLCRYTGQENIAAGSPIANRSRIEFEGLIGFFLNTLVLRTDLSGDPSFEVLLGRVREITLEAYTHQDLPFEKLVEELQPERDLNRNPLFQVLFVLHNNPPIDPKFSGLTLSPVKIEGDTAKFDLSLFITPAQQGMLGTLEYSTDLFDGDTIQRMLVHFQTLLEGIAANPRQRISNLPLLGKSDLDRLLVDWNDTKTDYGEGICVHELFEAQVQRTPHKIAALFGDEQLTYRELGQRADRLARRLQSLGVGPEVRVGLCMERSLETMIGLLAVLKAGGAYVPLDPAYPKERLAFMLEDAQVSVLLSEEWLAGNLPEHRATVIYPHKDGESAQNDPVASPASGLTPANLAYVIYTSGSTGKPKGVVMGHRALGNLISWQIKNFSEPLPARTLQFAPLGFDVSIQEMFATWCAGGSLILIKDELRRDGLRLLQYLEEESVERIFLPFVALQHLADAAAYGNCFPQSLREIITAGEQLQLTQSLRSFLNRLGDCCLRNQYGPTESHVVTAFTLKPPFEHWPDLPPIGRPIAKTKIYILDSHLNPVPVGVVGEIYVGGDGLARGYLNRPELTAEKFITDPFSSEPGVRLYRTGDLARYLPDGNIEFLGRIDDQVKIRGFRVELGEIEAVLGQHPTVREGVVLAREDSPGVPTALARTDKRLVAYIVAAPGSFPSVNELRSFLQQKLPEYMVPSVFVFLESLPLTPSGKIDRKSLPTPDRNRNGLEQAYVAPRDNVEYRLAKIWEDILGVVPIGVKDNFFESGGHSLLAVRLLARVEKEFNRSFPLAALFTGPTIDKLADLVRPGAEALKWNWLFPIQSTGSKPPLFLLHGSGQLGRQLGTDQPVYGGRTHGLDGRRAHPTVEKMAAEYVKEICMVQPAGPYFVGGFCFGGLLAFEVARQLTERDQEVALLLLLDPTIPGKGGAWSTVGSRLLQAAITRLAEQVRRHSRKLRHLSVQERLTRVGRGVQWRFSSIKSRLTRRVDNGVKMLVCRVFLAFGQLVPEALRMFYFQEECLRAARNYVPKVYSGRVVLLRAENTAKKRLVEWKRLLAGKIDIYELPSERHMDPIEGPRTKAWAERVRACLQKAQTNVSNDSSPSSNR